MEALLLSRGVDAILSRHIAHLFIRDPLVIFQDALRGEVGREGGREGRWLCLAVSLMNASPLTLPPSLPACRRTMTAAAARITSKRSNPPTGSPFDGSPPPRPKAL